MNVCPRCDLEGPGGSRELEFSKEERRQLRRLSGEAHERELGEALEALEGEFQRWRAGEIEAWELGERIHEFHDGESRRLFNLYNRAKDPELVARAIGLGLIDGASLAPGLLRKLEPWIGFYQNG